MSLEIDKDRGTFGGENAEGLTVLQESRFLNCNDVVLMQKSNVNIIDVFFFW